MRRAQPWLGTLVEIVVDVDDVPLVRLAVDEAFDRVRSIHAAMSFHSRQSELSRLNRAAPGIDVAVGIDTWNVLSVAMHLHLASDGLFDCAIAGPLIRAGALPSVFEIEADGGVLADVELVEPGIVRKAAQVRLDLGGIAKGYAVDAAVEALRNRGLPAGMVNAGGDVRCFGAEPRLVHVRDPDEPGRLLPLVQLQDAAVATSGGYFVRGELGPGASALVDPRRGCCVPSDASISVLAPTCIVADALTKVVALSSDARHPLLAAMSAQALVLRSRKSRDGGDAVTAPRMERVH